MPTLSSEDENFVYFQSEFIKKEELTIFTFSNGTIAISNKDIASDDNQHTLKKGAQITLIDGSEVSAISNDCPVKIPPTGREEKVSQQGNETTCYGVVMVCNYCVYNEVGVFTGTKKEVCGVCVGLPF